jgi:hypothetical protein
MRITNVLVDQGLLPVQDTAQLQKSSQKVLSAVDLVLKHLQEALTSGASLWD